MSAVIAIVLSRARNLVLGLVSREGRWALLTAGLVVGGYCAVTFRREVPTPLPAHVMARVEEHRVQRAVDSAEIKRLMGSAESERVKGDTMVAGAQTAADSGNYRKAYVLEDSALLALDRQVALLDVAMTKSEEQAVQADSVIAAVLPIAEEREPPCRLLWIVPCPTRRAAAVTSAIVTATLLLFAPKHTP